MDLCESSLSFPILVFSNMIRCLFLSFYILNIVKFYRGCNQALSAKLIKLVLQARNARLLGVRVRLKTLTLVYILQLVCFVGLSTVYAIPRSSLPVNT